MKAGFARLRLCLLGTLPVAFTSGCATPYLWNRTSEFQWKPVPATQVLAVTDARHPGEAVVLFKQSAQVGNNFFSRDVGWCVGQPTNDLATSTRTIHQLTNSFAGVESIPLYWADRVPTNAASLSSGYAVMFHSKSLPKGQWHSDATDVRLTIHRSGLPAGPYALPTSPHPKNATQRVLLMPLAVLVDVPYSVFGLVVYIALNA